MELFRNEKALSSNSEHLVTGSNPVGGGHDDDDHSDSLPGWGERRLGGERNREKETDKQKRERYINWSTPVHASTRDQTHNLGMYFD